jgi:membrane protein
MGRFIQIAKKAVRDFSDDDCMSSAAAMAYYAIFSLPPLLAVVVAIAGYFGLPPERMQKMVQDQWGFASASGDQDAASADGRTADGDQPKSEDEPSIKNNNGTWGIVSRVVGGVVLVFSATGLFAQLQYTLNRAWEVKPDPNRGGVLAFIGKRFLSLGMILVVVFLLLTSMLLTTVIDEIIAYAKGGPADPTTIVLGITLNNVAAFIVAAMLFAAMFKVLPDAEIGWRDVWFGAIVTALLFVIGKVLIAMYLQHSDLASGWGDAAMALIGVLIWMYYSSLIVLFGAELTQAWATEHGRAIEPSEGAVPSEVAK